jgi:SAM-dependent methyltransferase
LLKRLAARSCRTWSVVADDGPTVAAGQFSEGVAVRDLDRLDAAGAFPGVEFDVVLLVGALAHVASPAALLQGVTKVLTAEGRLVASVPNATHVSRRLRSWEGLGQDEEVAPGRPLRRAFTGPAARQLLTENGFSIVETLGVRSGPTPGDAPPSPVPPAVRAFLESDDDAATDHHLIVASPAAGAGPEQSSLAEELQRRLHAAEDDLAARRNDLATLENELEALQLDLALKDDFALELRGRVQTVEARAARSDAELAEARASLDAEQRRRQEQERELADLRRLAGRGAWASLLDGLLRRQPR